MEPTTPQPHDATIGAPRVAALILFIAAGGVLVYFVWEEINELLTGTVVVRHVLLGIAMLAILVALLMALARFIRRVDGAPTPPPTTPGNPT